MQASNLPRLFFIDAVRAPTARVLIALFASVLLLAGCGGGGGNSQGSAASPPPSSAATSFLIHGVAATGAPMAGAAIEVRDATGAVVATATADATGSYFLTVPSTAVAPFVVSAASVDGVTLYSPLASAGASTVNVTPVTTVITAQLSPTGDPSQLAAQLNAGAASFDAAKVASVVAGVTQALQPLLANAGVDIDPITGTFSADGTGYDRLLNSLAVTVRPEGAQSSITISVKSVPSDGSQPPEITFTSGTTPPALPGTAATAPLPPAGLDGMLVAFAAKVQECMALPLTDRVTGTGAADTIKAAPCQQIFFNDDPSTYKEGGANARADWSLIFAGSLTGMKSATPVLRVLKADGTMLVSWSNTTATGDLLFLRAVLTPQNGALKAIGNQYDFGFRVRAWSEMRDFLNTPDLSYRDTGFLVNVDNAIQGGASLFDHAVVTAPDGTRITLRPQAGLSNMSVVKNDGTLSGTSVVRLAGQFLDPNRTTQPRTLTGENVFWASNPDGSDADWTEAQIASMNNLGQWKADFFLAGNTGTTPDVTQFATTTVRAFTPTEIARQPFATPAPDFRASLVAASGATGAFPLTDGSRITATWTVPAGAIPPTSVLAQGFVSGTGARWNDSVPVSPGSRSATISCTAQTAADGHCSATTAGTYSSAARLNLIQLSGSDINDMQWISSNALFKVQAP